VISGEFHCNRCSTNASEGTVSGDPLVLIPGDLLRSHLSLDASMSCGCVTSSGRSGVRAVSCISHSSGNPLSSESPFLDIFISWSVPLKRMVVLTWPLHMT